jgi:DeoR/GlpR family transcriptional regulator of sugar metabolism
MATILRRDEETESDQNLQHTPMASQRRGQIAGLVHDRGAVRVTELAARFGVSDVTIRSDLAHLENQGLLTRHHGGAVATEAPRRVTSLLAIEQRAKLHSDEKQRIGRAAAELVNPGDTIVMDAGTTVVEMVPHLARISPLTIVTNALNVAFELARATAETRIILLGGAVSREAASTLGPLAERTLAEMNVQKAFLGTQAFDLENGLTDTTLEIAQVKRAMIEAATQVVLLSDSSKWAQTGFIKVAPLETVQILVSDDGFSAEARAAIERLGIHLRLV